MNAKTIMVLMVGLTGLAAITAFFILAHRPTISEPSTEEARLSVEPPAIPLPQKAPREVSEPDRVSRGESPEGVDLAPPEMSPIPTNKLERLRQVRETFRALAHGAPDQALRAAKEIRDVNQRETALFTLVTEWTQGELAPPLSRARAIGAYGLEAGLGMELTKHPELATLWADQLTDGAGRFALLQQTAFGLLTTDPNAAFMLSERLPQDDRRKFYDSILGGWAAIDTGAALQWVSQLQDPAQREEATLTIRNVAPVGIGAALSLRDGYPVINQLVPGTPAELSGQLHPGDRILALAQGGDQFIQTQGLPLEDIVQMIRGAPGSLVHLQVLSGDAPPNAQPRTLSIIRDQIKFKQ